MATNFEYPCPGCRTTSNLHTPDCRFDGSKRPLIEKAYLDIITRLSQEPLSLSALQKTVHDRWSPRHAAALEVLKREYRVRETEDEELELLSFADRMEQVAEPTREPLHTIYQQGSVPGAHDNAIFALIAFYEMVGFSWEETREKVLDWLKETSTWNRGGFEEATPEELVNKKRHVYDEGYGWMEKAQAAKRVIERHG